MEDVGGCNLLLNKCFLKYLSTKTFTPFRFIKTNTLNKFVINVIQLLKDFMDLKVLMGVARVDSWL